MALKLLVLLGICKLATSSPDPNVNVNVNVNVEDRDGGCGNDCADCDFSNKEYCHGSTHFLSCMEFMCSNGEWHYIGKIDNKNCGECQLFGEPQILTYDDHKTTAPKNWYAYNRRTGIFTVTQSGHKDDPTTLSVTSTLESEPNYSYYTTARSVCYWEPEITICAVLPSFKLTQCFNSSDPNIFPDCAIKVTANGNPYKIGKKIKVFNALAGNVLVFDHNHIGTITSPLSSNGTNAKNTNCINIVGSIGLSVSLCTTNHNNGQGVNSHWSLYSHLYVWVMPNLKGQLCGLCDTYTGTYHANYTMRDGMMTTNTDTFADSWMLNLTAMSSPDVNNCTDTAVLNEVVKRCASITDGVCKVVPPKCAGFIAACEFDLCRVSNTDDYAQGYANHLQIETHLNQQ